MAKVYALIEKSAIVVADLSSANTIFEVGMVLSKEGMAKPLILIADDQGSVPFDFSKHIVIRRPRSLDDESTTFFKALEAAFAKAFEKISPALEDEPSRLITKKVSRAAVIAAFSLMEHELRQYLELVGLDTFSSRSSLGSLMEIARSREIFDPKIFEKIRMHAATRNRIAHTRTEVSAQQAKTLVREISTAVARVREANLTLRSTGPARKAAQAG